MTDILLATWNSKKFLREQLDSIIAQTVSDWRLLIRDGGSSDNTLEIIGEYCRKDERIILVEKGKAGAMENFSRLLAFAEAGEVMFADHDDVWLPEKVEKSRKKLAELASGVPAGTPLCVFTDARVTDGNLRELASSNLKNQHLDPVKGLNLARLLVQNVPSGNTMIFNQELCRMISPIPPEAVMHDHYAALVAAAAGKIACLNEPTLLYRQHQANVLGSISYGFCSMFRKLAGGPGAVRKRFFANCRQAAAVLDSGIELDESSTELFKVFASLEKMSCFKRKWTIIRYGFWKTGLLRNLGMLILI